MNDLIKNLAYKTNLTIYAPEGLGGGGYIDNEREIEAFARAIVLECCTMINKHTQWNNPNDCLLVLDIKDKFGMEANEHRKR
jgi:hypothetical protein